MLSANAIDSQSTPTVKMYLKIYEPSGLKQFLCGSSSRQEKMASHKAALRVVPLEGSSSLQILHLLNIAMEGKINGR